MFSKHYTMELGQLNADANVEIEGQVKYLKTKMISGAKIVQNFALTGSNGLQILSHFPVDETEMLKVNIHKFK